MNRIEQWFQKGQPYAEGVDLYKLVGGNFPLRQFEHYLSAFYIPPNIKERLAACLQSHRNAVLELPELVTTMQLPIMQVSADDPKEVIDERNRGKMLLRQRAHYHTLMSQSDNATDRYHYAQLILEKLQPQIDKVFGDLKLYTTNGQLPLSNEAQLKAQVVEKFNRLISLRTRISRVKKLIDNEKDAAKRSDYEKELLTKEVELLEITNYLNNG